MSRMSTTRLLIWMEMARRKLRFHNDEEWNQIQLWGLFRTTRIRLLLNEGLLIQTGGAIGYQIWVKPSRVAWERYIKPWCDTLTYRQIEALYESDPF